ncbi:hypothetical protein V6Z12_A08G118700 [Gossypium hirsutum]
MYMRSYAWLVINCIDKVSKAKQNRLKQVLGHLLKVTFSPKTTPKTE